MTKLRSRKLHICLKVMESIIGYRMDYNGLGGLRAMSSHEF